MAREYHLLPWHFGGEQVLTDAEAQAFLESAKDLEREQRKAARANSRRRTRRR